MQFLKRTIPKKINTLYCFWVTVLVLTAAFFSPVLAQDNSPYSRYGIGDLVPHSNILSRGMGGITAAFSDFYSVNYNNPASFSSYYAERELKSKKLLSGRAVLDIGINVDNRTLKDPAITGKFTTSNALFSYVQVGIPLKKNWGLNFGLRPISRVSYNIISYERLTNPIPPFNDIDSAVTRFQGDGGGSLASVGTGFSIYSKERYKNLDEKLSIGISAGYLFGRKDYTTRRSLLNDSISYNQVNFQNRSTYGSLYTTVGLQYKKPLSETMVLSVGANGNWSQKLKTSTDVIKETFFYNENLGNVQLDSVSEQTDVRGTLIMPATYTIGFVLQKFTVDNKEPGWLVGLDFEKQNWGQYRFNGQKDSLQNSWQVRLGAQFNPVPKRNYFSNVAYRLGFFVGPDYIRFGKNTSQIGGSFGFGLPFTRSRQAPNQTTIINLAFEYSKRGNRDNVLSDNMFRVSLGFSLSDAWFIKRKYN